jgi:hypothetical protein
MPNCPCINSGPDAFVEHNSQEKKTKEKAEVYLILYFNELWLIMSTKGFYILSPVLIYEV